MDTEKIAFVNGINTNFGGGGVYALDVWLKSLDRVKIEFDVFSVNPGLYFKNQSILYYILLFILFLPGSLFRIIKLPFFETLYKISPYLLLKFFIFTLNKYTYFILSHHSILFLGLLIPRQKRVYLIHDLLFARAATMNYGRAMQRIILNLEVFWYNRCKLLLVQSTSEARILRKFCSVDVHTVSCIEIGEIKENQDFEDGIALASDWRRPENVSGALKFLAGESEEIHNQNKFNDIVVYGFGSSKFIDRAKSKGLYNTEYLINYGPYISDEEIKQYYFLVPIYEGSGIKRKVIDALSKKRFVIGSQNAFKGIPPWIISDITMKVETVSDLSDLPEKKNSYYFDNFRIEYARYFQDLGRILVERL